MHLLKIFKIKSLKMQLWHIANYETVQYKKRTTYRHQFDIYALCTESFYYV